MPRQPCDALLVDLDGVLRVFDPAFAAGVERRHGLSVVGHHKPVPEFFAAACDAVATRPARCLLVDDDHRHVAGARAAGLAAYRFSTPADLRYVRAALRIPA